jgi:glycine betaine catabolism B
LSDPDRHTTLVHVGQDHAFRSETERLARAAAYPADREDFQAEVKRAVAEHPDATFYLSGAGEFIRQTAAQLAELGVPRKHIKKDRFPGY